MKTQSFSRTRRRVRRICAASATAALYVVLTYLSSAAGMASGAVQFRLSEALCVLALITPAAVPGIAVGCAVANLMTGCALYDVVFGSLASLLGALGVYALRRLPYLSPLPYVLVNMAVIPLVLMFVYGYPGTWFFFLLTTGLGEIVCAWGLGALLYTALRRTGADNYIRRLCGDE